MQHLQRITGILILLLGVDVVLPANAQDVKAEAPTFEVGDWYERSFGRKETVQGTIAVIEVTESGIRLQAMSSGDVFSVDSQLNLYREEGRSAISHYDPSLVRFSFPLYVGKVWEGTYFQWNELAGGDVAGPYETAYRCTVDCIERIAVPAGEFVTFKTVCEYTDLKYGDRDRDVFWFSPVIGFPIKQVWEELHPAWGWRVSNEANLVAYKRAQLDEFDAPSTQCPSARYSPAIIPPR